MYAIQQKIIDKMNENLDPDVIPYTWKTIPIETSHK